MHIFQLPDTKQKIETWCSCCISKSWTDAAAIRRISFIRHGLLQLFIPVCYLMKQPINKTTITGSLHLCKAILCLEGYWWGLRSQEWRKGKSVPNVHCHHQDDSCIKMTVALASLMFHLLLRNIVTIRLHPWTAAFKWEKRTEEGLNGHWPNNILLLDHLKQLYECWTFISWGFWPLQFSSRWYLCVRKSPYMLQPVSLKFPQCCLWNIHCSSD